MAKQAVNSVTLAVIGELTSRVLSGLIQMCEKGAATTEKLQRLEMLLIKIHSTTEASEKSNIESSWLLRWRDKLKEAASQGDEVLARFLQPTKDPHATRSAEANQKQCEAASSATPVRPLSFMRNPLSGIMQGIHSASKTLFVSGDDDVERLNKILARLEKLWLDIGEFIRLLHLEALPKVVRLHGPTKKMRRMRSNTGMRGTISIPTLFSFSPPKEEKRNTVSCEFCLSTPKDEKRKNVATEFCLSSTDELDEIAVAIDLECDSSVLRKEKQYTLLRDRLEAAFPAICQAVELAGSRDLEDLEWLAYWTVILTEAKQQGCVVLSAISAHKTFNTEDNHSTVKFDKEIDEIGGFVHRLEGLASGVEYFSELVYLCRAC